MASNAKKRPLNFRPWMYAVLGLAVAIMAVTGAYENTSPFMNLGWLLGAALCAAVLMKARGINTWGEFWRGRAKDERYY